MNEDNLPIKDINEALLSTIVEVYARQDALMNMLVDFLMKNGQSEQALMDTYYADLEAAKKKLSDQLYAEYGDTPKLNSILQWDES